MGIRSKKIAELTGADCFILALDRMMSRRGQHALVGQTYLLLEGLPDLKCFREGAERLCRDHPILDAYVHRNPFSLVPSWRIEKGRKSNLGLNIWRESGCKHYLEIEAGEVESAHKFGENLLNGTTEARLGLRNLRLDLVLLRAGGSLLVLTWNHLLFDGKGAEFLVRALFDATANKVRPPASPSRPAWEDSLPFFERIKRTRPVLDRFFQLVSHQYQSLSGTHSRAGRLRYRLLHFTPAETEAVHEHATHLAGLYNVTFYLACAARAHRRVFLSRGLDPSHYVISIPVQVRRKGGVNDPFRNCVTILFFCLQRDDLDSLEAAVASTLLQFEEMTRSQLGPAFGLVLGLMRRIPALPYMKFLETQFGGEVTSFFHSSTGNFVLDPEGVCGARIRDAYHVPSISAPPGSGLFFSEYAGSITATFSWREGAVTSDEADLSLDQLRNDLLQGPGGR